MEKTSNPKPYLTETHEADLKSSGLSPKQFAITGHFSADIAVLNWMKYSNSSG